MTKSIEHNAGIMHVAEQTLSIFNKINESVEASLSQGRNFDPSSVVNNTFTAENLMQREKARAQTERRNLEALSKEPAIARVVARDETGHKKTYFICRGSPPFISDQNSLLVNYKAPIGRLASLPVGSEFNLTTPKGLVNVKIMERALLHPSKLGPEWDSVNSVVEGPGYGTLTIVSFLALLGPSISIDDSASILNELLSEERNKRNVIEGVQRNVILKMGLRDQPVLNQYQDEIFRLPIDEQLVILGPPGSGKTTTLIRRLGHKLESHTLDESERNNIERTSAGGLSAHSQSWIMFTPTELLKQYVKEAFARENIAASEQRINTWRDFSRDIARNSLEILKTPTGAGAFVVKDSLDNLRTETIRHQISWFEDFYSWQVSKYWDELGAAAKRLRSDVSAPVAALGAQLLSITETIKETPSAADFAALISLDDRIQALISDKKAETDDEINKALNVQVNRDRTFLDQLAAFLTSISDSTNEVEEAEDEEEDEEQVFHARIGREAAVAAYRRALRAQGRAAAANRSLGPSSKTAQLIEWLGDRSLPNHKRRDIGESLLLQAALRRFLNPAQKLISTTPRRYRRFRRARTEEGLWYESRNQLTNDINPLELDVILLGMLRASSGFLKERRISQHVEDPKYSLLRTIRELYKNQVMVDEITDFSPIQIACMHAISNPRIQSFFACGDFNQRVTDWGSRSADELGWAIPKVKIKSIVITYRHSRQLNDLANDIAKLSGDANRQSTLPDHVDSEGVAPVLGTGLNDRGALVDWLYQRIVEIEQLTRMMPSIAIFVNEEHEVKPLAEALDQKLAAQNIRAVACPNGQIIGQENNVRVFNVKHIKGLEFEAAFLIGLDELAEKAPDLFDKYFYVGVTRAATYLGVTCVSDLPARIESLRLKFAENWENML